MVTDKILAAEASDLRALAGALPQLIWVAGPKGDLTWANQRVTDYLGCKVQDVATAMEVIHAEDRLVVFERYKHCIQTGKHFEAEFRLRDKSGNYRWFLCRGIPVGSAGGKIGRWLGTATDIHDQVVLARTAALFSQPRDLQKTIEALGDLVVPLLGDWCFVDMLDNGVPCSVLARHFDPEKLKLIATLRENRVTRNWSSSIGVPNVFRTGRSELIENVTDEMLAKSSSDRGVELIKLLGFKSSVIVPLKIHGKLLGTLSLMTAESGRLYGASDLALAEQVAERAAFAIENASLLREARQAVVARDEFLSIASHELNTPLTSLQLQIQFAQRKLRAMTETSASKSDLAGALEMANHQVRRLGVLVTELLDVSRMQRNRLDLAYFPLDPAQLIRETAEGLKNQFESTKTSIEFDLQDGVSANWDASRIEQVLVNLLSNALKYAPGSRVRVGLSSNGKYAKIVVQDSGPGIPADRQSKIFDRFERASCSRHVSGLGLGLYIARGIVHAHRGEILLESAPGVGSRFVVSLPLSSSDIS